VRAHAPGTDVDALLAGIQRDLFALGAVLADPRHKIASRVEKAAIGAEDVARLEQNIDAFEAGVPPLRRFVLPGGGTAGAMLHLARTVCRRAERRMVAIGGSAGGDPVHETAVIYINRLSDLLFVLARAVNHGAGLAETEW